MTVTIAALTSSLGGMNKVEKMLNIWHAGKMFYALSTWGLALAGSVDFHIKIFFFYLFLRYWKMNMITPSLSSIGSPNLQWFLC